MPDVHSAVNPPDPVNTPHAMAVEAASTIHELWAEVDSMTAADRVAFTTKKGTAAIIDRTCRVSEREALLAECRELISELRQSLSATHEWNREIQSAVDDLLARLDARGEGK